MTHEELISLAKQASTPDVEYYVESARNEAGTFYELHRVVEFGGAETVYSDHRDGARPLSEGVVRMRKEIEAMSAHKRRSAPIPKFINDDAIIEAVRSYERMNSGEGATTEDVAKAVGFNGHDTARWRLKKLVQEHKVRSYEDPISFAVRYKVGAPK